MSRRMDGELDDLFPDPDLRQAADLISRAARLEVRPDPAFRSELRRTLLREGWTLAERRPPLWRRVLGGPGLAFAGAAVGLALVAVVAFSVVTSRPGRIEKVTFGSPIADAQQVSLVEPIILTFNAAMDQQSVERSITINPATQVTYQWTSPTTVRITPVSGDLAPNTQYQVTIAASASTVTHQAIARPQTIVFTTQPPIAPAPAPPPAPAPVQALGAQRLLAPLPEGAVWFQAAPDSSGVYFLGSGGSINLAPVAGGAIVALVKDGASSPSLSPDGSQIAFLREGKPMLISSKGGQATELSGPGRVAGWQGQKPLFVAADGTIVAGTPPSRVAGPIPAGAAVVSVSPAGDRAVYAVTRSLRLLDFGSGRDTAVGGPGAVFIAWSQDGKRVLYSAGGSLESVDGTGQPGQRLSPAPDSSTWPARGQLYTVAGSDLVSLSPDGTLYRSLGPVDFQPPIEGLADGTGLSFSRAGGLWFARLQDGSSPVAAGPGLDEGNRLIAGFMKARIARDRPAAEAFLDATGRAAYSVPPLALIGTEELKVSRWYTLFAETGSNQSLHYVVRLVQARADGHDAGYADESLILRQVDGKLMVDRAGGGGGRPSGQGPEVIAVQVSGSQIQVGFDSDLDQSGLTRYFTVSEVAGGRAVAVQTAYDPGTRTAKLTLTGITAGAQYRLTVAAGLKDVSGRPLNSDFALEFTAPTL